MGKRIITRRRGRGRRYQVPSFNYKGPIAYPHYQGDAKVKELMHDPGHTAVMAKVQFQAKDRDGVMRTNTVQLPAHDGQAEGATITLGDDAPLAIGNVLPIANIPEGTLVYNVEITPGDGGKMVRAGGTAAIIVSHGKRTTIRLPSGNFKTLHPQCRATIGVLAGRGRHDKPLAKAGKAHWAHKSARQWPRVRGVAKNPVDHPHGGGSHQHVGRPSTVSVHAPPGAKVGRLSPKKYKKAKRLKKRGKRIL